MPGLSQLPMQVSLQKKRPREAGVSCNIKIRLVTASVAAIAASAAVTTTTATTTATIAAASASTTRRTRFAWTRLVDCQRPAFHSFSVQLADSVLRVLVRAHGDKGKTARFTGEFILHKRDFLDSASLREELLQFVFGRAESKISDV